MKSKTITVEWSWEEMWDSMKRNQEETMKLWEDNVNRRMLTARLLKARIDKNLSMDQLSELSGVQKSRIMPFVCGYGDIPIFSLVKILKVLELKLETKIK